jgi:hypothetical protein
MYHVSSTTHQPFIIIHHTSIPSSISIHPHYYTLTDSYLFIFFIVITNTYSSLSSSLKLTTSRSTNTNTQSLSHLFILVIVITYHLSSLHLGPPPTLSRTCILIHHQHTIVPIHLCHCRHHSFIHSFMPGHNFNTYHILHPNK